MTRTFKDYFKDMYESVLKVEIFVEGLLFQQFLKDNKTQFAVIRALEIIGEASKKIPKSLKIITQQFGGKKLKVCGTGLFMIILVLI